MSELISGEEAKKAWANGESVQIECTGGFFELSEHREFLNVFDNPKNKFRLKPRTVNLNGVEVGQLYSSQWDRETPYKVVIEFKTEEEAIHFNNNALKIFNGI